MTQTSQEKKEAEENKENVNVFHLNYIFIVTSNGSLRTHKKSHSIESFGDLYKKSGSQMHTHMNCDVSFRKQHQLVSKRLSCHIIVIFDSNFSFELY